MKTVVLIALLASSSSAALAQEATTALPPVTVDRIAAPATIATAPATATRLTRDDLRRLQAGSSDTAALIATLPGVAVNTGGGFAGMPVVRGLSEQRLNVTVDGFLVDVACPNDMNSPLSYTDPQNVSSIHVITGVSPVSMGGDSIGAVIAVNGPAPRFAKGQSLLIAGEASAAWRSNDDGVSTALSLTMAGTNLSATYTGSFTTAGRYYGGGNLGVVRASEYRKTDHALALAWQGAFGLIELKGGYHTSPYEGFVNQAMDMTDNQSWFVQSRWRNSFDWGNVDFRADYREVYHQMNFLADKGALTGASMPMFTHTQGGGYNLKLDVPLGKGHTLHTGSDAHFERMNDWWTPVAGSMMMGPNSYININHGQRDRIAAFAEVESRWSEAFATLAGVRFDRVSMDTGAVAPYAWSGMMQAADIAAATAFNAANRQRSDDNWSASLLASYAPRAGVLIEAGYAHKTRSPNLYERYTWGRGMMASRMIGWYGDGNGYVGNLNLRPEQADTLSLSVQAGDAKSGWLVKAEPYYTRVHDYIDAVKIGTLSAFFNQLQFTNVDAEFYGVDVQLAAPALDWGKAGTTRLTQTLSWLHGENTSRATPLYHQMPLQVKFALSHRIGGFEARANVDWTSDKTRVDPDRKEPTSRAYALVSLHAAYGWKGYRLSIDAENLLDKAYYLPLGGQSLGDFKASGNTVLHAVAGRGRSINLGFSALF